MDITAQANAAISASIARDTRPKATCRDCGCTMVAWVTSTRTGRPYLADATLSSAIAGGRIPAKHLPHFKRCAKTPCECAMCRVGASLHS
jgi:hypothetical protein